MPFFFVAVSGEFWDRMTAAIDTWNVDTFDDGLLGHLRGSAALLENYFQTERQQFLECTVRPTDGGRRRRTHSRRSTWLL